MFRTIRWTSAAIILVACGWYLTAAETTPEAQITKAQQELKNGNFKDAYDLFREVLLNDECPADQLQTYLNQSTQCLQRLNRQSETDELRREMLAVHENKWQAYQAAAQSIYHDYHYGMIVAGKFHRGGGGSGVWVSSIERDRVEALRWTAEARKTMWKLAISPTSDKKAALARLEQLLIQWERLDSDAWKLQILTDLSELPDFDDQAYGYGRYGSGFGQRSAGGAPVDAEGNPVYHTLPESYDASISDGQRWRWLMEEIVELTPDAKWGMQMQWANFLWTQFGVQTMGGYIAPRSEPSDDPDKNESNPYAVGSLNDDETIAKLATGIKRFSLPDEFNFIKQYREVIEAGKNSHDTAAYEQLASIYTNRRQFPKAATVWRELIARHELQPEDYRSKQLDQIVKNWGRFEPVGVFVAGESVELPFRFRNADQVEFTARRLDVEQLLTDVKDYIKKIAQGNQHLDWQKLNIHDIGQRIIHQNEAKYIKEQVAAWNVALKPLPEHKDDLLMVTPPLENGGAYLVEGSVKGGNKTRIIVWLADLAIVKKPVDGRDMIYVADAATGQAIPQANVEFFGYRNEHVEKQTYRTRFSQFAKFTDQNGLIFSDKRLIDANMNWLTIARKGDRFAFHGYLYFSRHGQASEQPQETKLYVVTDRPVYRPGDSVKLKFWVRTPSYDPDAKEPFLKESLTLEVHNPKGEKLLEKQVTTDQYGGYADELTLDENATLGVYQVVVYKPHTFSGSGSFRVEEYKKPEYEVTVDAPSDPVKLGELVTAKIVAKYYFGAPVTNAKVHYKVT
ncbi:MAG TPA: MG2 domain-containing protein, partial [Planctomycetaceae bacterium]|nr:MG2 domain-containing protein [Planctomycetaceae bacterium]